MKKSGFENIGDRLNQYESNIDLDMEWSGVKKRQQKKKKKRRWIFFWMSFLLVAFSFSAGLYHLQSHSPNDLVDDPISELGIDHSISPSLSELEEANIDVDGRVGKTKLEKSATANLKKDVENIDDSRNTSSAKLIPVNSKGSQLKDEKLNEINNSIIDFNNSIAKTLNPPSLSDITSTNSNEGKLESLESTIVSEELEITKAKEALLLFSKPLEELEIPSVKVPANLMVIPQSKKRNLQVYLTSGFGLTQQLFQGKDTDENAYAETRKEAEVPLETYFMEGGVNVFLNKKSYLSIGANYSIWFDKINHTFLSPKAYEFEDVLLRRTHYTFSEAIDPVYGDTIIDGMQRNISTQYNRYKSLNLTASFGHYVLEKNRFGIAVSGGMSYNVMFKSQGNIIDIENPSGTLVPIQGYKNSYGLGLLGGVDFDYSITKRMLLNLRVSGSYSLFSATRNDYVVKSNFYSVGVGLGVKYSLFRF